MEKSNIITVAWTCVINTNPAMCYISVRPERYSYNLIKESGEFVINLTTKDLAYATDWCGVKSGADVNKFEAMGLTAVAGQKVASPYIEQSPLSIECKVREVLELGTHHMFIADVVNVIADDRYIDPESGAFNLDQARMLVYNHGKYYKMGDYIGHFGWSVRKKPIK